MIGEKAAPKGAAGEALAWTAVTLKHRITGRPMDIECKMSRPGFQDGNPGL